MFSHQKGRDKDRSMANEIDNNQNMSRGGGSESQSMHRETVKPIHTERNLANHQYRIEDIPVRVRTTPAHFTSRGVSATIRFSFGDAADDEASMPCREPVSGPASVVRFGKLVPADEAFLARNSGDFPRMLKAMDIDTNLIDRHFLLQCIVEMAYHRRDDPEMRSLCRKVSEMHIHEFPDIAIGIRRDNGHDRLPRVSTYQHYATLLTEDGQYDRAIDVCKQAISFGLDDGTKSGYEGRIARILKKRAKAGG